MNRRTLVLGMGSLLIGGQMALAKESDMRIIDTQSGKDASWKNMLDNAAKSHAVFLGEQHDDTETHRVELSILKDLYKRVGKRLILSMEMFERDQQILLDQHLAGVITAAELGQKTKLWNNYATDYAPMVQFSAAEHIPVLAANCPNAIIRKIGQGGLAALASLPESERKYVADSIIAPDGDAYAQKFMATMSGMGGAHGAAMEPATLRRIYEAQCTRDDTMAESIVRSMSPTSVVLHVNGGFHSEGGLGTVARVQWRRPIATRTTIIHIIPTKDPLSSVGMEPGSTPGNYVVFVKNAKD